MDNYTLTAKKKIKEFIDNQNGKILTQNGRYSILEVGSRVCKVTLFGYVSWD